MNYDAKRARELLREGTAQAKAEFREGQEEAIRHIVEGRGRLLVIQRTGWGKSYVYFIACRLLREGGAGPSILISPLLSLMRNQLQAAERMGLRAVSIHSDNREEWVHNQHLLCEGQADLLLISPERLANEGFCDTVLSPILREIAMLVVDEAHCISDWGHDFRPYYRLIERVIPQLPASLRLLATTATANARVMRDLEQILGPDLQVQRGELARPSLVLQNIELAKRSERMAWLAEQLPRLPGSGIVYTLTVRDAQQVAAWLQHCGITAKAYYSGAPEREQIEDQLMRNRLKVLVATTALGMGFDKPDIAFVIHYQMPASVVAYYQQVGRAGRALEAAYGILLYGKGDKGILDFFIRTAFPSEPEIAAILQILSWHPQGLSDEEIARFMQLPQGQVEKALALLAVEEPAMVRKWGRRWCVTGVKRTPGFQQRARRLTQLRCDERDQMLAYTCCRRGQMRFLVSALDSDEVLHEPSTRPQLPSEPGAEMVTQARQFQREYNDSRGKTVARKSGGRTQERTKASVSPSARGGRSRPCGRRSRRRDLWLPGM